MKKEEREQLQLLLQDFICTCESSLTELDLPIVYQHVDARDHDCFEPIKILYCSANNDPICIYCVKEQPYVTENKYPHCNLCADYKPAVTKRQAFYMFIHFLINFCRLFSDIIIKIYNQN